MDILQLLGLLVFFTTGLAVFLAWRLVRSMQENRDLSVQKASLATELAQQKLSTQEKLEAYAAAESRLKDSFEALSSQALRSNGESFLQLAHGVMSQQNLKAQGELDQRRQAVDNLVQPLSHSLEKVEQRIQDLEKQRVGAYQGLQEQIHLLLSAQRSLQHEASQLATALKSPTTRGQWGELQLRRTVEISGMLAHCDFYEQESRHGAESRQRPDVIVRLPGKKSIAIDAKVPLQAYLEAINCDDEHRKHELMQLHAQQVRRQVTHLSQKSYWDQMEGSPEFVLLFLPGESIYSAALQADPSLLEFGSAQRVICASPTTLIATLKTAYYAWRQEDVTQHAEEISRLGRELYQRLADLSGHVGMMGKSLGASVDAYNKMVGTIESRVLVSARRFQELKADDPKKQLKDLERITEVTRALQAPELRDDF